MTVVLLGLMSSSCSPMQHPTPTTLPRSREEVFEEGYKKLQELARTAENEHLAFFVEWSDGTFSWGRWAEGSPLYVVFPPEWLNSLCRPWVRKLVIAHTHVSDLPPSELDVDLQLIAASALKNCGVTMSSLVVTPQTTWVLEALSDHRLTEQCGEYTRLWQAGAKHAQRDIDHLGRRDKAFLPPYYRCTQGVRVHLFTADPDPSASRK